ncbi:MAG: sigma-70 factor domain-containing protein, partial [Thermomicrobium sp.]
MTKAERRGRPKRSRDVMRKANESTDLPVPTDVTAVLSAARAQGWLSREQLTTLVEALGPDATETILAELVAEGIVVLLEDGQTVDGALSVWDAAEETDPDLLVEDPVRLYLAEIGRVPLLTAEEEVQLGQAVEAAEYLAEIRRTHGEDPVAIVRGLWERFRTGWPLVEVFAEGLGLGRQSRSAVLSAVLPLRAISPTVLRHVLTRFGTNLEVLEEELRRRRLEFALFPEPLRQWSEPGEQAL